MRTPALEPKNRIAAYHFRMLDSRRLGEETALAGLPWQTYQHADQEEHESYMAGWKETVATLAISAGRLAEAEDVLDASERQPRSFMEYVIQKFFKRKR